LGIAALFLNLLFILSRAGTAVSVFDGVPEVCLETPNGKQINKACQFYE